MCWYIDWNSTRPRTERTNKSVGVQKSSRYDRTL